MSSSVDSGHHKLVVVSVDQQRCIGSGQCEMLEEQTFHVDDDTSTAQIHGAGLLDHERAKRVADTCPAQAIEIDLIADPPKKERQ